MKSLYDHNVVIGKTREGLAAPLENVRPVYKKRSLDNEDRFYLLNASPSGIIWDASPIVR